MDEDWVIDFFGQCQDIGNETLQSLWSRLLTGEVANPGSFSRRTLHTVRMLEKRDADLFTKLAGFVWETPSARPAYLVTGKSYELLEKIGFYKSDLLHLQSIGLLESIEYIGIPIRVGEQIWCYCGTRIRIEATVAGNWHGLPLSQVGAELLPISGAVASQECLHELLEAWNGVNCRAEILNPDRPREGA